MRIGIVGTESSHVDQFVDHLNVRAAGGGARVVALSGGASERNELLRARGGVERVVDAPAELLGLVDAVIVADRDGGLHRAHALPFLEAGLPVLVDKPLARTVADAEAIVAAARAYDAPLTSYSALRLLPATDALAAEAAAHGAAQVVVASGPADPDGPYGGVFFYGIHPVDVALRLAPGPLGDVRVERSAATVTATALAGGTRVVVNLVLPTGAAQIPFHALVVAREGIAQRTLTLDAHYLLPALTAFLGMARTGRPPVPYDDLLRPVRFLQEVAAALRG
ncbi:Gfo/Idh/MocA family oxidoreductase [Streptomyces sp. NPDC021020]|uniref:Gfo/Idh/MocA family oxidoreductase n=1 Tax=Streptomyces sp. NPDC021020 TaxID=3365109 RepID=UPI0037BD59C7